MSGSFWKTATIILVSLLIVGLGVFLASQLGVDFQSLISKHATPKEAQLDGEIFIVTRGRQNVKLGLVTVKVVAVPENNLVYVNDFDFVAETKTNSDGKFSVRLPMGRYRLFAETTRYVFGETETYRWDVAVTLDVDRQSVILSNDNLCEENCFK